MPPKEYEQNLIKKENIWKINQQDNRHFVRKSNYNNILVHNSPFILTCDNQYHTRILQKASIIIENGVITEVVPSKKIKKKEIFDLVYDAGEKGGIVITPGLINTHSHPPMYLMRSAMMLDEGEAVDETIAAMPKWERAMDNEDYFISAIGDITEQQKFGITTTLSHYAVFKPIEKTCLATGHNIINAISVVSNTHPENSIDTIKKLLNKKNDYTSKIAIALHYLHKATKKDLVEIEKISRENNLLFTCHMAESKDVVLKNIEKHGSREVETLKKYKLLNNRTIVSHAIHINKSDINNLIQNKVGIVHLPTSNTIHKSGVFPFWSFCDNGGLPKISLGTDSVVSKNRLDILNEAYQTRLTHLYSKTVKFSSLFKMMTINGANVLNMEDRGKILPGCKADLAFWKLKDRGFIPYDKKNPMTLIGNFITHHGRTVRDLMINGKFVIKERRHLKIDESKLLWLIQKKHDKMRRKFKKMTQN